MRSDVVAYITGCETCARRKGPQKRKRAPMQIQRSGFPMERIAIDILGELPKTANDNKYILVIADYYTKWTESFPMENMEASTVANIIVTEIICRFGVPTQIHSDQGRQFETAEEAVASERSIGCIQGKALNTSKVVTQTKQSNTRTGPDKVNIEQLPQVKHWPKSSRYKAVATSKALYIVNTPLLLESTG
ncbi:unnamed protein product [Mytilus coruscus]|uniref:Integrase catalytic domain-containing protein n=1 Tax=Mytilus coruscus TaxID=42192 RepID=A0A6J8DSP5_MYTCO|nr:unnamed protein product [Mytilus coruscus]